MIKSKAPGSKCAVIAALSIFFVCLLSSHANAQVGFRLPDADFTLIPLTVKGAIAPISMATPFDQRGAAFPQSFQYIVELDSMRQSVTAKRQFQSQGIFIPRRYGFQDFLVERSKTGEALKWEAFARNNVQPSRGFGRSRGGITLESGRIKSEAFKKLFGGETVSLNIDGSININGRMAHESRSNKRDATNRPPATNFKMEQKQRFTVTGKIGENITVDVDQDSESDFEFENAVRLRYSSDEDGIVKSIEAGNVSLSLAGTQFATHSQKNAGLFGLKADFQIGKLGITAIASMEKGEKKTLSFSGNGETTTDKIDDYNYKKGTYFFLDNYYRDQYAKMDIQDRNPYAASADNRVYEIEVYKSQLGYTDANADIEAWAVHDPESVIDISTLTADDEQMKRWFKRLKPVDDYFFKPELGYLQMRLSLQPSEMLAVSYRLVDANGPTVGTTIDGVTPGEIEVLKLIKAQNPKPYFQSWDLEWKNVYDLGAIQNITDQEFSSDNFDVKIYYKKPGDQAQEAVVVDGKSRSYIDIFGLDKLDLSGGASPDNKIDNHPNIINKARGEIIIPNLRPFDPRPGTGPMDTFWASSDSSKYRTPSIYDKTIQEDRITGSHFYIEVTSSRSSASYSLGMNIIEGTEEITLNGRRLTKDIDYQIDYMTGQLNFLNEDATAPNAKIDVNYESQRMFSNDKKVMAGVHAEYLLWEKNNKRSFIGGTFLYLDKSIIDKRIRIDKEAPMRNMLWDINGAIDLESNAFTNWLNKVTPLDLVGPSKIAIQAEVAQIIPNPNTLNNKKTGDDNGVAYIDDFEGAKRLVPLGVMRRNWRQASPPLIDSLVVDQQQDIAKRGNLVWYNPYAQERIQDIWPNREVTTNYGGTTRTHIMTFDFIPEPDGTPEDSWGSVQRALSPGYYDQTNARFLEIWVRPHVAGYETEMDGDEERITATYLKPQQPRLHIDLGQISEDAIPNYQWNTEDFKPTGGIRDTNLEPEAEDAGLDGVFGDDPPQLFAPHEASTIKTDTITVSGIKYQIKKIIEGYDFFDLNGDGIKQATEPWSYDDYKYDDEKPGFLRPHTLNADGSAYYYDNRSGSINGTEGNKDDGTVRYPDSEDLNANSDVDYQNNFYRFTIDLDSTGSDFENYMVSQSVAGWRLYRIPLTDATAKGMPNWQQIESARISIDGASERTFISIAEVEIVANEWRYFAHKTQHDTVYTQEKDLDNEILELAVINTHDNPNYVAPKGVTGEIDPQLKIRSKEQSLILKLNGLEPGDEVLARKKVNDLNFIQYKNLKLFVHGGDVSNALPPGSDLEFFLRWGEDTAYEIYYEARLDSIADGWDDSNKIDVDFSELSVVKLKKDQQQLTILDSLNYSIHGNPSMRSIKWLLVGVRNRGKDAFTGEVWMDEMRLSNISKEKGMAKRASVDFAIGDLISGNARYESMDANFHKIAEQSTGQGLDKESYSTSITLNADKLLPKQLGMRIPVTGNYSKQTQTPKYIPGSDILLDKERLSEAEINKHRTTNKVMGLNARFSKPTKSRNPVVRFLVDPLSGNANYTSSESVNPRTGSNKREGMVGGLNYNLRLGNKVYFKPFGWLGNKGILGKLAQSKFYAPSDFSIKMDGRNNRTESTTITNINNVTEKALFDRVVTLKWKPITSLSMDYNLTDNYDLKIDSTAQAGWSDLLSTLNPGTKVSQKQNISTAFSPKPVKWFTPTFRYTTNYAYNFNPQMQSTGTARSANVSSNFTVSGRLDPKQLIAAFKPKKKKRTASAPRRGRRAPVTRQGNKDNAATTEKKTVKKSGKTPLTHFFGGLEKMVSKITPLSINYSNRKGVNSVGLDDSNDPSLMYQLGLTRDPGVRLSENLTSDRSSLSDDQTIRLSSGLKITRNITLTANFNFTDRVKQQNQNSKTESRSVFFLKYEGDMKEPMYIPSWTLNWKGIEKYPLINKVMKTMSIKHGYDGKMDNTFNGSALTQQRFTKSFNPLIGVTATFKGDITANFTWTVSENITSQLQGATLVNRKGSDKISLTMRYAKRGGLRLPFLKGKKLDNNIDFSLTFNSETAIDERMVDSDVGFQPITEITSWKLAPKVDYSFTKNVTGGLMIELGKYIHSRTGDKTTFALAIDATINLSGR